MYNRIVIHGYLGKDPELTEHQGKDGPFKKVSFSVGVSRSFGDQTDWFRCSMTGTRAEVIDKFFSKGSQIIVAGQMESYKTKEDRTGWYVKVMDFDFCDKVKKQGAEDPEGYGPMQEEDEEIDF